MHDAQHTAPPSLTHTHSPSTPSAHTHLVALLVCALACLCGLVGWVVLAQLCVAVGLGTLQEGLLGGLEVLGLAL